MTFKDIIKNQLLTGFKTDISTPEIVITLIITFAIAIYLYIIYRAVTENAFYSKNFNISMVAMAIVTSGIIMAMQSSLVISLGMVGALSIVRFRTAIKEPMDLLFLFWSIGTGIICGAGLYKIAVVLAVFVTVAIMILKVIPDSRGNQILFIGFDKKYDDEMEKSLEEILKGKTKFYKIKSRNINENGWDAVYEVRTKNDGELVNALQDKMAVKTLSIVSHDDEFRG